VLKKSGVEVTRLSNTVLIFPHKKQDKRLKNSYSNIGLICNRSISAEIGSTLSGSNASADDFGEITALKYRLSFWFKDSVLSTFSFLLYILTYFLIPGEKAEKGIRAYYLDKAEKYLKRVIDILGSSIGLLLCLPLFFIVGLLIKLDSAGPVFFKQERVGINRRKKDRRLLDLKSTKEQRKTDRREKDHYGKTFYLYKFRTMVVGAEKGCGPVWAKKDDPRITNIGKVLRKTRIDELPQLFNVLRGEMSLVGPRPERYHFVRDFVKKVEGYPYRLKVKPGITGLAQVENGYDASVDDVKLKVRHDLNYIKEWSLGKDFVILLKTVLVVATGKGAC
jgi:lipopolysaccharide/colanic/teichoic acid biosynthesis glycosyltransferase